MSMLREGSSGMTQKGLRNEVACEYEVQNQEAVLISSLSTPLHQLICRYVLVGEGSEHYPFRKEELSC